jgi:hypothetical protein
MERCPYCNAELPPVAYFCPICGQKLSAQPAPAGEPEQVSASEPAQQPAAEPAPGPPPPPPSPPAQEREVLPATASIMLGSAFMAGIAAGVLAGVPQLDDFCCLWTLACGALAVFFFRVQFGRSVLPGEASRLGLLSGFFGFLVAFLVALISHALIRRQLWGLVEFLRDQFRQRAELMNSPNADRVMEVVNSPGGGPFLVLAWAITYLFGFLGMSILGALLTGAILRRRD